MKQAQLKKLEHDIAKAKSLFGKARVLNRQGDVIADKADRVIEMALIKLDNKRDNIMARLAAKRITRKTAHFAVRDIETLERPLERLLVKVRNL